MSKSLFSIVNPALDASVEPALVKIVNPSPFDPLAEQEAIIGDLEKYMEYYITVLCFTNPGDGPNSVPVYTRTKEDGEILNLSHACLVF